MGSGGEAYHVVCKSGIGLSTSSHTTESVEHAGAEEADKCNHAQLNPWGRIPGNIDTSNATTSVLPACRESDITSWLFGDVVSIGGGVGSCLDRRRRRFGADSFLFRHVGQFVSCLHSKLRRVVEFVELRWTVAILNHARATYLFISRMQCATLHSKAEVVPKKSAGLFETREDSLIYTSLPCLAIPSTT